MTGNSNTEGKISIPSKVDQVAVADEFLENWLRNKGIDEDVIANMAIAVTELVNNAIKHGNKLQQSKKVTLAINLRDREIRVSVADEGGGFDPGKIPDPLAKENLLKEIGRGIFIVKSLMDSVEFEFLESGGTKVVVSKKIT